MTRSGDPGRETREEDRGVMRGPGDGIGTGGEAGRSPVRPAQRMPGARGARAGRSLGEPRPSRAAGSAAHPEAPLHKAPPPRWRMRAS